MPIVRGFSIWPDRFTGKGILVFRTVLQWLGMKDAAAKRDGVVDLASEISIIQTCVLRARAGNDDASDMRFSRRGDQIRKECTHASVQLPTSVMRLVESAQTFSQRLMDVIAVHCGGVASECYGRAGVRRQTFSKIMSQGGEHVSKRIALQLCIGAKASVDEAEEILKSAGYSFRASSYEDAVFKWCLQNKKFDMLHVNALLAGCGCSPCDLVY